MNFASTNKHSILAHAIFLVALICLPAAAVAAEGEFLLFPTITGLHRNSPIEHYPQDEIDPSIDAFYSASHERVRFLAEFFASQDHKMIERMKIGWLTTSSTTLWLGRFHNPLGYWNTEFHHGNYLTTTITRPSIIAFEKHGGGVLPMHLSGIMLEKTDAAPINYNVALGIGPTLEMMGLVPVDILQPTKQHGRLAASARLIYRPKPNSMSEYGIFAARTVIPAENISMTMGSGMVHAVTEITQTLAGTDFNQEFSDLRLIGELYFVHNRIEPHHSMESPTFASGFLQAEYAVDPRWNLYGRVEDTAGANGDLYLDLRHDFVKSRTLAGARHELSHNQALKLELSHSKLQDKSQFNQIGMEWSAVFP